MIESIIMVKVKQKKNNFSFLIFLLIILTSVGLLINNLNSKGIFSLSEIKNELFNETSSEDILSISDVATAPQY